MANKPLEILSVMRRALIASCVWGAACVHDYERHSPEEVRAAIEGRHPIGSTPDSVIAALRSLRFVGGDTLQVGSYVEDVDRRIVEASLDDAKRTGRVRWTIDIVVSFDSTRKSVKFDVEYSAVNPM